MDSSRRQLNRAVGTLGEDAAANYLAAQGYRLLERNSRCPAGEIDIIAEERGQVVFVEVKARSPRARFAPEEAVDARKQSRLAAAAKWYLGRFRDPSPHRFDIVSVHLDERDAVTQIELRIAAFGDGPVE
jgi:putative endonuclease